MTHFQCRQYNRSVQQVGEDVPVHDAEVGCAGYLSTANEIPVPLITNVSIENDQHMQGKYKSGQNTLLVKST